MHALTTQDRTQNRTTCRWPGDVQAAEEFCRAIAGSELAGAPLYLVPQSILPAECGTASHCYGYTTPSLDLYLAEHISNYLGRGPCMVINDVALAEDFAPEDLDYVFAKTVMHELAHILDRPALFANRAGVEPARIAFESLVVAKCTARPERADLPAYFGHEAPFIRIALHLCYRAERIGISVSTAAICAGYRYGLSHASDYQEALGDEPTRCARMSLHEIATIEPPSDFTTLWAHDMALYHDRFSRLKGAA